MNTNETLLMVKDALSKAQSAADLAKSFTQSGSATTGLTAYMLEAPAKTLYPVITPLRNKIPRAGGGTGIQANWRAVTKINSGNMFGGVSEGNRGGVLSTTTTEYLAAFRTLGMEDWVSFEADLAAQGFDDVKARAVQGTLQSLMVYEEQVILGGNGSVALGTTPTPVLSTATSGGSIANTTTVYVRCVALTPEGYAATVANSGVLAQVSRTNADASVDSYGGGSAMASASASQATGASGNAHTVSATVTAVKGAVGYAWYAGTVDATAPNLKFQGVTTINSIVLTSVATGTSVLPTDLVTNDRSINGLIHDGLISIAAKSGSGAYWQALATGTAGTGTPLTSDGAGGIVEIDTALKWFWDNQRLSPSEIWVSSQEMAALRKRALIGAANGAYRFTFNVQQGTITAGSMVRGYLNPYSMAGAQEIPILLHPNMPPGTIMFLTHQLPYRMSGVDSVVRILTRKEYYQLEWPLRTRKYEYGVYVDQVLQHYYPPSLGIITNIANG